MSLRALPLGVGDAFSNRSYSSAVAVETGGRWLLFDCPHPIRKMMREASLAAALDPPLDIGSLDGVILSHLHADHGSGLEGLAYFARFLLGKKATLLIHPDVLADLWDGHLRAGMQNLKLTPHGDPIQLALADYFDIKLLDFKEPVEVGPFRVEARPTVHHIPTTAVRIHGGGRTLGLSADTYFDQPLIDWLAESDLFFHETNHGIHTPYEMLAALPEEIRKKMRLIHYPDDFDTKASVIESLEQGRLYEV